MKKGFKMSMIRKDGNKDYYGEFSSKDSAEEMARDFMMMDSNYIDYKVWYFEK